MVKKNNNYSKTEIKKFYRKNGFFIFRNVIDKKYIKESLKEIDFVLKSQWRLYFKIKYPGRDIAVKKLFYRNKNYRRFLYEILNKRMLGPIQYTKIDFIKKICLWIDIKTPMFQDAANRFHIPGEKIFQTGTHQDIGIMKTNNSVTFWLPLVESKLNSGSLKFWKGSHQENVIIPDGPDYRGHTWINKNITKKYEEVWEEYMPGDLVMFHTKIISIYSKCMIFNIYTHLKSSKCTSITLKCFNRARAWTFLNSQAHHAAPRPSELLSCGT